MEPRCEVCGAEAEFESPADLCDYHWKLWWYTGVFNDIPPWDLPKDMNKEEREFYLKVRRDGEYLDIESTDDGKIIVHSKGKIYN